MAKTSGSSVKINMGKETTFGVAPVAMTTLKNVTIGESLNSSASEIVSNTITEYRDVENMRNGLYTVSGSFGVEIATQGAELFYEGLLGAVDSEETELDSGIFIKTYTRANTVPSFTIERIYTNATMTDKIQVYKGVKINSMNFTFEPGSIVSASVEFMGATSTKASTVIDASPDVFPHIPFAGIDASSVTIDGVATKVLKGTLNITNAIEVSNVLGSQYADDIIEGKGEVSGEFDLYFSDRTQYDMFVAEEEFPIELTLTRGAEITKFTIPRAKFSGNRDIPVSTDKALIATYTFKGLVDEDINGAVKIGVINAIE